MAGKKTLALAIGAATTAVALSTIAPAAEAGRPPARRGRTRKARSLRVIVPQVGVTASRLVVT